MSFNEEKELFFKNNNIDLLIELLERIEQAGAEIGDYAAFGAEFVLNGIETGSEWYNARDFIEDRYENVREHGFNLYHEWDSFLFYNPSDFRGLIFDFSYIRDGKIIAYNGLTKNFTHEVVKEFTIDEFMMEYGMKRFFSCTHYRVQWPSLGFSWNN